MVGQRYVGGPHHFAHPLHFPRFNQNETGAQNETLGSDGLAKADKTPTLLFLSYLEQIYLRIPRRFAEAAVTFSWGGTLSKPPA